MGNIYKTEFPVVYKNLLVTSSCTPKSETYPLNNSVTKTSLYPRFGHCMIDSFCFSHAQNKGFRVLLKCISVSRTLLGICMIT